MSETDSQRTVTLGGSAAGGLRSRCRRLSVGSSMTLTVATFTRFRSGAVRRSANVKEYRGLNVGSCLQPSTIATAFGYLP